MGKKCLIFNGDWFSGIKTPLHFMVKSKRYSNSILLIKDNLTQAISKNSIRIVVMVAPSALKIEKGNNICCIYFREW